jgi:hypothetical protein
MVDAALAVKQRGAAALSTTTPIGSNFTHKMQFTVAKPETHLYNNLKMIIRELICRG